MSMTEYKEAMLYGAGFFAVMMLLIFLASEFIDWLDRRNGK